MTTTKTICPRTSWLACLLCSQLLASAALNSGSLPSTNPPTQEATDQVLLIGGLGAVYFLAEPGELTVELEKRDRNRGNSRIELRAVLAGPDRQVLQEQTIPDDGKPSRSGLGPAQRCRFAVPVARKGVYVLNLTLSNDRYGQEAVWGFRSNCRKYVIETEEDFKKEHYHQAVGCRVTQRQV